ncbi:MAG: hypothetical protein U1A27_08495 [Phycisphaerae bacterium]
MQRAIIWADPWDLIEAGPAAALDQLAGELGANGVCVLAAGGPRRTLRAGLQSDCPVFETAGGAHFRPDAARYVATRLRAAPAEWLRSRNPFETIARACQERGVALHAALPACAQPSLARSEPSTTCRDVFGRRSLDRLCPANGDAREWVASAAADLAANYAAATIVLTDPGAADSGPTYDAAGARLSEADRLLASLCFCESCARAAADADVPVERVMQVVRAHLLEAVRRGGGDAESLDALVEQDAALRGYLDVRRAGVVALVAAVRKRAGVPVVTAVPRDARLAGFDARGVAAAGDGLLLPSAPRRPDEQLAAADAWVEPAGGRDRLALTFDLTPGGLPGAAALVSAVHAAVTRGHSTVGFAGFGVAGAAALDAVRQAIRYARRESGG